MISKFYDIKILVFDLSGGLQGYFDLSGGLQGAFVCVNLFSISVLFYIEKVTLKMMTFYVNASPKYYQIEIFRNLFDVVTNLKLKVK